ncbi:hypothetical protein DFJ74DRAFT_697581 [Hyaloraphidium curvatum]|nr:hypothetical protein DFJ74DRAFT_697581 [Hyaloraphidium curvatum]
MASLDSQLLSYPSLACSGHVYCSLCGLVCGYPAPISEGDTADASLLWLADLRVLYRPWEASGEAGGGRVALTGHGTFFCGRVKSCCVITAPVVNDEGRTVEWRSFRPFKSEDSFPIHGACWDLLSGLHANANLERLLILFRRRERWPLGGWPRGLDFNYGGPEDFWNDAFRGLPRNLRFAMAKPSLAAPAPESTPAGQTGPDRPQPWKRDGVPDPKSLGTLFTALDSDALALVISLLDVATFDRLPVLSASVRAYLVTWPQYWRLALALYWPWMKVPRPAEGGDAAAHYRSIFRTAIGSDSVKNTDRIIRVIRKNVGEVLAQ